jgi:myo-inositol-1(or 4)-monophosphatase
MDLQNSLQIAMTIARGAGDILRQGYKEQKRIETKSTAIDLVTQFDRLADAFIAGELKQAFPDHRLVAEESGESNITGSPYVWYVDPLDGTNNFAHSYPFFAVSMALYEQERPLLGVIYEPLRDECFTAVAGQGAFLRTADTVEPLRVTGETALVNSLLATGFPYDRHTSSQDNIAQVAAFLKQAQGIRRAGAACLDLAYVAAGRLDGYWEYKLNSWDVAAGLLLVQEAGGQVTAVDGSALAITSPLALVASNGRIHQLMVEVIRQVESE